MPRKRLLKKSSQANWFALVRQNYFVLFHFINRLIKPKNFYVIT